MEFDHVEVSRVVEEDRLSSLPHELIHHIFSFFDLKFAVQTCVLSSRWKLLWTSMPSLNFSTLQFDTLRDFTRFLINVLSKRNHQVNVSSVHVNFHGAANEVLLRQIADYAFSQNVQQLTVVAWPRRRLVKYPPCLLSSRSLKSLTYTGHITASHTTLKTNLDYPGLTTLHLSRIKLCGDIFSKCVNLMNLTIEQFVVETVEVFDIIAPRLCNLKLIYGTGFKVINVIAPQLEDLIVTDCSIDCLNAPPGLSSLCYRGYNPPMQLCKDGFHSLNKVTISLFTYHSFVPDKKVDARKIINMLQELHSARYLTLNAGILECISSFPDLLSHRPSPFSNLIYLTLDYKLQATDDIMRKDAYKFKMNQAISFLLGNSPNATVITHHGVT